MSNVSKALPARHDEVADMHRRATLSCLIGNCIKLDDFMLYGVFAIFWPHGGLISDRPGGIHKAI